MLGQSGQEESACPDKSLRSMMRYLFWNHILFFFYFCSQAIYYWTLPSSFNWKLVTITLNMGNIQGFVISRCFECHSNINRWDKVVTKTEDRKKMKNKIILALHYDNHWPIICCWDTTVIYQKNPTLYKYRLHSEPFMAETNWHSYNRLTQCGVTAEDGCGVTELRTLQSSIIMRSQTSQQWNYIILRTQAREYEDIIICWWNCKGLVLCHSG